MIIKASASTLRRTRWHQYAVRFFFGGAITAIAGLIAKHYGPELGGLFLAFPAIFPAAATLAQQHEEEKKKEKGLPGKPRGILVAGAEANGTALGSIALAAFAVLFWLTVPQINIALLFPLSIVLWLAVAIAAWFLRKRIHLFHRPRRTTAGAPV
ncbi:MAG TPA: hypothetical protein VGL89_14990 [Candidatus Koribacter sp.]|jgi:hypothetical protein